MRKAIDTLLPRGAAWEPIPGGDYDKLLQGISENSDRVRQFLEMLAYIRDPKKTELLEDLEKEFGIVPLENATEEERRNNLHVAKTSNDGNGSNDFLEQQLRAAGFDVYVHDNNPPVDPNIFLDQAFQLVAGGDNAYAGRPDAYAGRIGGELLVNGDQFEQAPAYIMQAGGSIAYAGNSDAIAGRFDKLKLFPIEYDVPTDPGYWPLIFFVGGVATRDGSGALTDVETANIPIERKSEFKRLILKFKPMHSWAGLIVNYT